MTMGQRIYQARVESGLSQRQLAGAEITRNMLSALEHDTANPSVATLRYLSERLGRPVSYFLGEDVPQLPEYPLLAEARQAWDAGEYRRSLERLDRIECAGEILGREIGLLRVLSLLGLGEQAIEQGLLPYARTVLDRCRQAMEDCPYCTQELSRRLAILRAQCPQTEGQLAGLVGEIPGDDPVLMLRARAALTENRFADAQRYLCAMEQRSGSEWSFRMGQLLFARKEYQKAAEQFHRAEETMPQECRRYLEICYREQEDYKMAYYYATK